MEAGVTAEITAGRGSLELADKLGRARIGDVEHLETKDICCGIEKPAHGFDV